MEKRKQISILKGHVIYFFINLFGLFLVQLLSELLHGKKNEEIPLEKKRNNRNRHRRNMSDSYSSSNSLIFLKSYLQKYINNVYAYVLELCFH